MDAFLNWKIGLSNTPGDLPQTLSGPMVLPILTASENR